MCMSREPEQYGRMGEGLKNKPVWTCPEDIIALRGSYKAAAFYEWFQSVGGDSYPIEAGAFKESGTNVSATYVVIVR